MEWEPSTAGMRVYTWSGNQSQEGNKYVYMEWEPITGGMIVYTWSGNQSQEGREYIPGVGTNHRREESTYLEWEPSTGGMIAYTGFFGLYDLLALEA